MKRRALNVFVACLGSFLLTALVAEGTLRVAAKFKTRVYWYPGTRAWQERLWRLWLLDSANPVSAPYPEYANRGTTDERRVQEIFRHSRLPASQQWDARDFLQSPERAEASLFHVRINSLGFRDPERTVVKPPNTFRILCFGSYETFGEGVDDADTYPSQLEKALNRRGGGLRYEVWNGGKPGATAIMGFSQLKSDAFGYKPDLIILEYGFVDSSILDDYFMPYQLHLPRNWRVSRKILRLLTDSPFGRMYICGFIMETIWGYHRPESLRRWIVVMNQISDLAKDHGVPVVLLDHPSIWYLKPLYQGIATHSLTPTYMNVLEAFRHSPPSSRQLAEFDAKDNWLTELRPFPGMFPELRPYFVDFFHPSRLGNRVIAESLVPIVERISHTKHP